MNKLAEIRQIILVSRQVEDKIHPLQGPGQVGAVRHIPLDKLGLRRDIVRLTPGMDPGLQGIENANFVALSAGADRRYASR